jgi:hypothetical protein
LREGSKEAAALAEIQEARDVRVLGTPENAGLIVELYAARGLRGAAAVSQVQVGGPKACSPGCLSLRPEVVLDRMRFGNVPGSLGGWHALGPTDYISYLLVHLLRAPVAVDWGEVDSLLAGHPAWPAVSFLHLREPRMAALLSQIVDPRWHLDPCHPERGNGLFRFLGLTDIPLRAALIGKTCGNARACRAELVLGCLRCQYTTPSQSWPRPSDEEHSSATSAETLQAMQRSCRKMMAFVRDVWRHHADPCQRELFVPEHFFPESGLAQAYRKHVAKLGPLFQPIARVAEP